MWPCGGRWDRDRGSLHPASRTRRAGIFPAATSVRVRSSAFVFRRWRGKMAIALCIKYLKEADTELERMMNLILRSAS